MTEGFVFWSGVNAGSYPVSVRSFNGMIRAYLNDELACSWQEPAILAQAVRELSAERDRYKAEYFELKSKGTNT